MQEQYNAILNHLFELPNPTRFSTLQHNLKGKVLNVKSCIRDLKESGLVSFIDTGYGNETYALSKSAREMMNGLPANFKNNPYGFYLNQEEEKRTQKAEVSKMEFEKLSLEVNTLRAAFCDYDENKSRSKWTFRIAVASGVLSLIAITSQLLCNMPGR